MKPFQISVYATAVSAATEL